MEKKPTIHWAGEALDPQPPIPWIVEGVFSEGSLSVVFGEPGSKKTFSMIDATVCVTMGKQWLNFNVHKVPGLIVDEESGKRRLFERIGASMRAHGAKKGLPLGFVTLEGFDLSKFADIQKLRRLVHQTKAKIILLDAFTDFSHGDENSVKDTQPVLSSLRSIAEETQSAIVVIHHSGKSGGYRGSSSIMGGVDLMLHIQSKPDSPNVDFTSKKARDVEPFSFAAIANFGEVSFHLSPSIKKEKMAKLSKTEEQVLAVIEERGDVKINEIKAIKRELSRASISKAVNSLAKRNIVERIDGGGKGTEATYGLASFNFKEAFDEFENMG